MKKITVENMKEYLRLKKLEEEDEHDELVNEVFNEIIEKIIGIFKISLIK